MPAIGAVTGRIDTATAGTAITDTAAITATAVVMAIADTETVALLRGPTMAADTVVVADIAAAIAGSVAAVDIAVVGGGNS